MGQAKRYVPILKWKEGERIALRRLSDDVKDQICPVISVMRNTEPDSFAAQVGINWGAGRPFYLDVHSSFLNEMDYDFLSDLLPELQSQNLIAMPVLSSDKSQSYNQMVKDSLKFFTNGIAVRIRLQDFDDAKDILLEFQEDLELTNKHIDLILDLGQVTVPAEILKTLALTTRSVLRQIKASKYRSTTVSGGSFPESLRVPQQETSQIPRKEWELWKSIYDKQVYVDFGDYGADDPHDPVFDYPPTIVPTIRYTHKDSWFIIRGRHDPRAPRDFSQYHVLSKALVRESGVFCGKDFSWSDQRIYECAKQKCLGSPGCNHGNPKSWVTIATNHHLTYVAHQVSSLVSS